jgi:hypothetical protein
MSRQTLRRHAARRFLKVGISAAILSTVVLACIHHDKTLCSIPTAPGCASSRLFKGQIAAAFVTKTAGVLAVAADTDGSRLGALSDSARNSLVGAVFATRAGSSMTVYVDSSGLPKRAVAGGVVFLFANYTSTTVDVATVTSDGQVTVYRNSSLGSSAARVFEVIRTQKGQRASSARVGASRSLEADVLYTSPPTLSTVLKTAGFAIEGAGCVISGLALPATLGASEVLAAAACGSLLANVLHELKAADDLALEDSENGFGAIAAAVQCLTEGGVDCAVLLADALINSAEQANAIIEAVKGAIPNAEMALIRVAFVIVSPASVTLQPGDPATGLTAQPEDATGQHVLTGRTIAWSVSGALNVVALSGTSGPGVTVTPLRPGSVTIAASSEGIVGTATITVAQGAAGRWVGSLTWVCYTPPQQLGMEWDITQQGNSLSVEYTISDPTNVVPPFSNSIQGTIDASQIQLVASSQGSSFMMIGTLSGNTISATASWSPPPGQGGCNDGVIALTRQ